MLKRRYKDDILRAVAYHFPSAKVYLFGADFTEPSDSDSMIDIAIDIGKKIHDRDLERARITLTNLPLPFQVFARDLRSIPQNKREYVISLGTAWQVVNKVTIKQLGL